MILSKIIYTIFIGLLLSVGLWIVCYILLAKLYPRYSLQARHHLFSFLVALTTFGLYGAFSVVSATISGIEHTLNSAKIIVSGKSGIVDELAASLLSAKDQQTLLNDVSQSVSMVLRANGKLDTYIDFSKINDKEMLHVLNAENLSIKEKSAKLIDRLFAVYMQEATGKLHKIHTGLLLLMVIIQCLYFGTMISRAKKKSAFCLQDVSQLLTTDIYD